MVTTPERATTLEAVLVTKLIIADTLTRLGLPGIETLRAQLRELDSDEGKNRLTDEVAGYIGEATGEVDPRLFGAERTKGKQPIPLAILLPEVRKAFFAQVTRFLLEDEENRYRHYQKLRTELHDDLKPTQYSRPTTV